MSSTPLRSLTSLSVVVLGAALLAPLRVQAPAANADSGHRVPAAVREKLAEPLLRYDRPDEALEFYRFKRAPRGEKAIPAERYLKALEQMRTMPQHSTAQHTVLPSRAELASRGLSVAAADST